MHKTTAFALACVMHCAIPSLFAAPVAIRVTEAEAPVPCRIHLKDAAGEAVKPASLPAWHDHFVCEGDVTIDIPAGEYTYTIERGPEYIPVHGAITVSQDTASAITGTMRRRIDMPARGWWPGDLHVHRPLESIELLMRAEALHIAPVITWWNKKNLWAGGALPAEPLAQFDTNRFYHRMAGEDEREGGAFLYFGRTAPMDIAGASREWPSPMAYLESAIADRDTWIDIEKPFWWDVPVALALGYGDSIGLANNHMCRSSMYESEAWGRPRDEARLPAPRGNGYWTQEIYYHVIDAGLRIPPSAGSASGVLPNPVGYNRVYVHVDGELTYDAWWKNLRAGHCFVTNGPMLMVAANGEKPGHVFQSADAITIDITCEIATTDPVPAVEIVRDGRVVRTVPYDEVRKAGSVGTLRFTESGWFLVRAIADVEDTFRFASTGPFYLEIGETPRRISRKSATFFLDWVRERRDRIALEDAAQSAEVLAYHDKAEAFWTQRVDDANAE